MLYFCVKCIIKLHYWRSFFAFTLQSKSQMYKKISNKRNNKIKLWMNWNLFGIGEQRNIITAM